MALLLELLGRTGEAKSLLAVIKSQRSPDGGFYAAISEGYRLGSCWIPIRPSHNSISDCHILAQLRGPLLQNGGSIPLRRQKDFRS